MWFWQGCAVTAGRHMLQRGCQSCQLYKGPGAAPRPCRQHVHARLCPRQCAPSYAAAPVSPSPHVPFPRVDVLQGGARGVRARGRGGRHRPMELPLPQHFQPPDRRAVCRQRDCHQGAAAPPRQASCSAPQQQVTGGPLSLAATTRCLLSCCPAPRHLRGQASARAFLKPGAPRALLTPGIDIKPTALHELIALPPPPTLINPPAHTHPPNPTPLHPRCQSTPPGARCTTSASSMRRWRRRAPRLTWCRHAPCRARAARLVRAAVSSSHPPPRMLLFVLRPRPGLWGRWARCHAEILVHAPRRAAARTPHPAAPLFPPQIVTGYGEAGNALVTSPDVGKIIFVGSTHIGRKVCVRCRDSNIPPALPAVCGCPRVTCYRAVALTAVALTQSRPCETHSSRTDMC